MSMLLLSILLEVVTSSGLFSVLPESCILFVEGGTFYVTQTGPHDTAVAQAAQKFGLSPFLLKGLLMTESRMDPAAGSKGGRGIASFTPAGVAGVNWVRKKRGSQNVFTWAQTRDPEKSIFAAAELLSYRIKQFRSRDAGVSAYNGGGEHGRHVRRYGYWGARKRGLLEYSGGIRMSGRYLLSVLEQTNLLRTAAGLRPIKLPRNTVARN